MENKKEIRKNIRNINRTLTEAFKIKASKEILHNLENLNLFKQAKNILIYYSLNDEVSTKSFINKWIKEKNIFLPKVDGENLQIIQLKNSSILKEGKYNIMEPVGSPCLLDDVDIIVIPAVAISRNGQRIGRGKGYYDRLLQNTSLPKIGIIYDHQLCPDFETEPHDVNMDYVITQSEIIKI